jgi:hypothetical protein
MQGMMRIQPVLHSGRPFSVSKQLRNVFSCPPFIRKIYFASLRPRNALSKTHYLFQRGWWQWVQ